MTQESKVQKQMPVGLDDPIDRGNILDTTCFFSIPRDIGVFENPEHKAQKQRLAGHKDKRALATSAEDGFQRLEDPSLEMLSVDPPKLELSDLGNEFSLENFPFLEDADSNEIRDSSKIIPEMTTSLVEALALAPSELRLTEKEIKLPLV